LLNFSFDRIQNILFLASSLFFFTKSTASHFIE
jgi:hypothetical protein